MSELLWALWVFSGGNPHYSQERYALKDAHVAAYFKDVKECERVAALVRPHTINAHCIQATYVITPFGSKQQ